MLNIEKPHVVYIRKCKAKGIKPDLSKFHEADKAVKEVLLSTKGTHKTLLLTREIDKVFDYVVATNGEQVSFNIVERDTELGEP